MQWLLRLHAVATIEVDAWASFFKQPPGLGGGSAQKVAFDPSPPVQTTRSALDTQAMAIDDSKQLLWALRRTPVRAGAASWSPPGALWRALARPEKVHLPELSGSRASLGSSCSKLGNEVFSEGHLSALLGHPPV